MRYSNYRTRISKLSLQNSKEKDICPRCTRNVTGSEGKRTPGLFTYYKILCKSTKCLIHQKNTSDTKEATAKYKKNESKNFILRQNKLSRLLPNEPCHVTEFEEKQNIEDAIDPELYTRIETTVTDIDNKPEIEFEDVISHGLTKEIIKKTIIWPLKKPEIFKGLRRAPKGVLLFGPPGSGKTLIGKIIAFETKSTLFNITASCLTSKWMGESEKLVRIMFAVAKARQPSVIFIDDVDSILLQRSSEENGSSRRMKNEFLICMDGSASSPDDRVMVIGVTTRPQELDEAARRRFCKRLYIPLPDEEDRKVLLTKLLEGECHSLEETDIADIVRNTERYSAADIENLCHEAAMGPIKSLSCNAIVGLKKEKQIRPISVGDFSYALELIKPSVSKEEVKAYENWNAIYGFGGDSLRN